MKRILIVEDSFIVSKLLKTVLASRGYEVTVRETKKETLEDPNHYDFVILDYKLPDGNGTELVPTIRSRSPGVPIVLLTARGNDLVKEEAKKVGINEFLEKPVDTSTLIAIISHYIR